MRWSDNPRKKERKREAARSARGSAALGWDRRRNLLPSCVGNQRGELKSRRQSLSQFSWEPRANRINSKMRPPKIYYEVWSINMALSAGRKKTLGPRIVRRVYKARPIGLLGPDIGTESVYVGDRFSSVALPANQVVAAHPSHIIYRGRQCVRGHSSPSFVCFSSPCNGPLHPHLHDIIIKFLSPAVNPYRL